MSVLSVAIMFASPIAQSPKLGDFFYIKTINNNSINKKLIRSNEEIKKF